jgi:hypothetical protein
MVVLRMLHIFGAIFMVGGFSAHLLLRLLAARVPLTGKQALYDLGWQIQLLMVYPGAVLLLLTGLLLWLGHFSFLTGWLLLGSLIWAAVMGLDGAFLAPSLRRARRAASTGEAPNVADAAAVTIQAVVWFLLLVVVFLMTVRPF